MPSLVLQVLSGQSWIFLEVKVTSVFTHLSAIKWRQFDLKKPEAVYISSYNYKNCEEFL